MNKIIREEIGKCYAKKKKNSTDEGHLEHTEEEFSHLKCRGRVKPHFEGGKEMRHADMQISEGQCECIKVSKRYTDRR